MGSSLLRKHSGANVLHIDKAPFLEGNQNN